MIKSMNEITNFSSRTKEELQECLNSVAEEGLSGFDEETLEFNALINEYTCRYGEDEFFLNWIDRFNEKEQERAKKYNSEPEWC